MIPSINCCTIRTLKSLVYVNNQLRLVIEHESGLPQITERVIRVSNIDEEIYEPKLGKPWFVIQHSSSSEVTLTPMT
jgi:hypothetical protein